MTWILEWLVGPFGRAIEGFLRHNPIVWTVLLGSWFLFYLAGHWQLDQIRRKTEALTLEKARTIIVNKPNVTASGIYRRIRPAWDEQVIHWAWFVPHRLEMWPVAPTPGNVLIKFAFSAEWVATLLKRYGIPLAPQDAHGEGLNDEDHGQDH